MKQLLCKFFSNDTYKNTLHWYSKREEKARKVTESLQYNITMKQFIPQIFTYGGHIFYWIYKIVFPIT